MKQELKEKERNFIPIDYINGDIPVYDHESTISGLMATFSKALLGCKTISGKPKSTYNPLSSEGLMAAIACLWSFCEPKVKDMSWREMVEWTRARLGGSKINP